ncbi:MAG: uroporphyrinogen-III decarboxylase-like protein [Chloroflexi bacterium]|nr:MAG: uroporphyrinogen-III decarboxylase-like protein [Chloroflexota bacterium]
MARESMTPRERWLAVLTGEKPDRVPMDYWGTAEANAKVRRYLGCQTNWQMFRKLRIDKVVGVAPKYVGPRRRGYDMYGCRVQMVDYGSGAYREVVSAPLAQYESVEEIESNYTWPSPDWFDYSVIQTQVKGKEDYPVRGGGSEPFLIYANLRGREQAYVDLLLKPEIVHYCLDKLFDLAYENTCRIYEQIPGRVDLSYVAEDFGGQSSLLFSPDTIRTFFIPRMKRMIDLAHQNGARVFFHSDGAIRAIIPDMIAAGIDILNPIQWRAPGMEREALKRDFGGQVVFHGGMDNQQTLPFGSVEEVRAEVQENLALLGAGGGYILAPCHNIQAVSPAENVVAMYETGYTCGWL